MKKLLLSSIILLLLYAIGFSQETGITKQECNLYPEAKARKTFMKIEKGETVNILSEGNMFYHVNYNQYKGYIVKNNIKINKTRQVIEPEKIDLSDVDAYKFQIDHLRYCMKRYGKQKNIAYMFQVAGMLTAVGGASQYEMEGLIYVGGGLAIVGTIMQITAEKWMKIAHIGPTEHGFGIKYKF